MDGDLRRARTWLALYVARTACLLWLVYAVLAFALGRSWSAAPAQAAVVGVAVIVGTRRLVLRQRASASTGGDSAA